MSTNLPSTASYDNIVSALTEITGVNNKQKLIDLLKAKGITDTMTMDNYMSDIIDKVNGLYGKGDTINEYNLTVKNAIGTIQNLVNYPPEAATSTDFSYYDHNSIRCDSENNILHMYNMSKDKDTTTHLDKYDNDGNLLWSKSISLPGLYINFIYGTDIYVSYYVYSQSENYVQMIIYDSNGNEKVNKKVDKTDPTFNIYYTALNNAKVHNGKIYCFNYNLDVFDLNFNYISTIYDNSTGGPAGYTYEGNTLCFVTPTGDTNEYAYVIERKYHALSDTSQQYSLIKIQLSNGNYSSIRSLFSTDVNGQVLYCMYIIDQIIYMGFSVRHTSGSDYSYYVTTYNLSNIENPTGITSNISGNVMSDKYGGILGNLLLQNNYFYAVIGNYILKLDAKLNIIYTTSININYFDSNSEFGYSYRITDVNPKGDFIYDGPSANGGKVMIAKIRNWNEYIINK